MDSMYLSERSTEIDAGKSKEIEELSSSIERQKAQIERMKANAEDYKIIAGKIFERMGELNELLSALKKKNPKSLDDAGRKFGNINLKGIDAKRKTVKIELE